MRRRLIPLITALLALLLALALLAPVTATSAPLGVAVHYPGDGSVVVSYTPPAGQLFACALRGTQLLGCDLESVGRLQIGPGSQDARARVRPGERVEVRSWNVDGEIIATGEAIAGHVLRLPVVGK